MYSNLIFSLWENRPIFLLFGGHIKQCYSTVELCDSLNSCFVLWITNYQRLRTTATEFRNSPFEKLTVSRHILIWPPHQSCDFIELVLNRQMEDELDSVRDDGLSQRMRLLFFLQSGKLAQVTILSLKLQYTRNYCLQ